MQSDISYTKDGMFTRFMPNTKAGEAAWRVMAQEHGVAAVLNIHAQSVIAQLKKAGYSVSKEPKNKMDTDAILAELACLESLND